jgi:hypothetical protein
VLVGAVPPPPEPAFAPYVIVSAAAAASVTSEIVRFRVPPFHAIAFVPLPPLAVV